MTEPLSVRDYYRAPAVQARILEFCGGAAAPTAVYIAPYEPDPHGAYSWETAPPRPLADLMPICEAGRDVARSLWDTAHLLFFFELDYQNIDRPDEPFVHPVEVFFKLEPAYRATLQELQELSIVPAVQVSGRSYHFTGVIPLDDPVIDELAALVPTPGWHATQAARRPPFVTTSISERHARAATGLGCLIEHVAHLVLARTARSPIPVVVNGTVVGTGLVGREAVSIDFSHAGDPLDVRHVRTAFSTYQIHRLRPDVFGAGLADAIPPLACVPRGRLPLFTWLSEERGLRQARFLAQRDSARIPDVTLGITRLLNHYRNSPLAGFHRRFYDDRRTRPGVRPLADADVPPCVTAPFLRPNDLLLRPAHIQHAVRGLMAAGWPAADIAALVEAAYRADHHWGTRWLLRMDPATRAEFEVRTFAGLIETGVDALVDFNCVSAQEKAVCPRIGCPHDLREDRDRLLSRIE